MSDVIVREMNHSKYQSSMKEHVHTREYAYMYSKQNTLWITDDQFRARLPQATIQVTIAFTLKEFTGITWLKTQKGARRNNANSTSANHQSQNFCPWQRIHWQFLRPFREVVGGRRHPLGYTQGVTPEGYPQGVIVKSGTILQVQFHFFVFCLVF